MSKMGRILTVGMLVAVTAVWTGCKKPPENALSEAEDAVAAARDKSECAEEKFEASRRLLQEAKKLSKQKKYDEAERKARAAAKLAEEAKAKAEANWEDCQKRLAGEEADKDSSEEKDRDSESGQRNEKRLTLKTVYFGYDTAELSSSARSRLQSNLQWLEDNPERRVVLEGHTDARGSIEYNLALGERRARSVKQYLIQLGISGERLNVLSYGEEKPAAFGDSESAYRKNRRVEFVPK